MNHSDVSHFVYFILFVLFFKAVHFDCIFYNKSKGLRLERESASTVTQIGFELSRKPGRDRYGAAV